MKNYFITAEIINGGNTHSCNFVLSCLEKDLSKRLNNYFKDFFGEETEFEGGYYSIFSRSLQIKKTEEISDVDFGVLKKYITEI